MGLLMSKYWERLSFFPPIHLIAFSSSLQDTLRFFMHALFHASVHTVTTPLHYYTLLDTIQSIIQ